MTELVYCPICGNKLGEREEGGRMRQACDNCGYVHYVNPVPAVGILIEMDGGMVLIRRGQPPHQGEWTLPSGFIEADESAEDAAIREAEEETGLKVEIIEMAGINSFPEGPPTSGIIIFYRVRPISGTLKGGDDALEARVFLPNEMPRLPFRTHREIIAEWMEHYQPHDPEMTQTARVVEEPPFIIRPAEGRDLDEVMALLALIPVNRGLGVDWDAIALRFRESAGVEVFVAEARQMPPIIIGFIALSIVRTLTGGRGFINDMAVLPTYQRRGVGAALLEAVVRRANRLNLQSLMVNAQRANDRAKAFYAASGFSEEMIMHFKMR
ncbi:MAG: GNAT family N-acetyltransferase [Anaerolineae bacterium]|nr:GNAT family N-acetyltransferase [Anaerolineae bacterium]